MELNSSVVIESSVAGSLGSDNENGMLLVMMICLYNALITTEAGKPSLDMIDSACIEGSENMSASDKAYFNKFWTAMGDQEEIIAREYGVDSETMKDALKEFLPGRLIQFKRRNRMSEGDIDLKMSCVDGALKYIRDKRLRYADIELRSDKLVLPYTVSALLENQSGF